MTTSYMGENTCGRHRRRNPPGHPHWRPTCHPGMGLTIPKFLLGWESMVPYHENSEDGGLLRLLNNTIKQYCKTYFSKVPQLHITQFF